MISISFVWVSSYLWIDERLMMMNVIRKNRFSFWKTIAIVALFSLLFGNSLLYANDYCHFCHILSERTPETKEYTKMNGIAKSVVLDLYYSRFAKEYASENTLVLKKGKDYNYYVCTKDNLVFTVHSQNDV